MIWWILTVLAVLLLAGFLRGVYLDYQDMKDYLEGRDE